MPQDDLEPLITECPSCQTRFRVGETQLQRARGRVRCGACLTVFDGVEHLVLDSDVVPDEADAREALDDLLDELAAAAAAVSDGPSADEPAPAQDQQADERKTAAGPGLQQPADNGARPEAPVETGAPAAEPTERADEAPAKEGAANEATAQATAPDAAPANENPAPAAPTPVPVPAAAATASAAATAPAPAESASAGAADAQSTIFFGEHRDRRPWVWAGIAAGVVLLVAQILWYQFDSWAVRPEWRGVYSVACGLLGCELPAQRDPERLSTRNLVVRSDPEQPGTLVVDAVIVNAAEFAQPFPVLELQFTTLRGNLVASRRYHPDEYLAGDAAGLTLIPPRTPVQIALRLDDPGPHAVNYRLSFR